VEIYSTKDGTGRKLSVHKEQLGPGVAAYFIDMSTPCGAQRCVLSASFGVEPRACPAVVRACRRVVVPTGDAAETADASRGRLTNSASLRSSRSDMHTTIAYDERRA
jgi:hypothetical protein